MPTRLESLRQAWRPEWAHLASAETIAALREEYMPEMPPLNEAGYLVPYLMDAGPTMAAGMGSSGLTSQELLAWQHLTAIELEPWEATFIRRLSKEYLNASYLAEKRDAKAPWETPLQDISLAYQSEQLRQSIRRLVSG